MAKEKILIVDDDLEIRELVSRYLTREGFVSYQADCALAALALIEKNAFDLVVLDIMMNDMDGYEVLQIIRKSHPCLPVIFLSARQEDYDKILGFGLGADDYVTKPFSPAELTARIKAHIKRINAYSEHPSKTEELRGGDLCLNTKSFTFSKRGTLIDLSAREFKLLQFFLENPNQVFTKLQIYNHVWGDHFGDNNSVMVYISHLRDKIEDDPKNPIYVQTVRGIGYKFSTPFEEDK